MFSHPIFTHKNPNLLYPRRASYSIVKISYPIFFQSAHRFSFMFLFIPSPLHLHLSLLQTLSLFSSPPIIYYPLPSLSSPTFFSFYPFLQLLFPLLSSPLSFPHGFLFTARLLVSLSFCSFPVPNISSPLPPAVPCPSFSHRRKQRYYQEPSRIREWC